MRILAPLLVALAAPVAAEISFVQPLDCALGETCFIQNYVDLDPSPAARDFTCGALTYDGHKGTDFALHTLAELAAAPQVLAAAPGTVTATRTSEVDRDIFAPDPPEIAGRECGNGLVIDHGNGWETQYCHMREVTARPGDRVAAGDPLGTVGLTGQTEFPHLHFAVRQDGAVVDPFAPASRTCGETPVETLWQDPLAYTPGAFITSGWADAVPDYVAIKAGTADGAALLTATSPALVFWAYAFGGRAGDTLRITITREGATVVESEFVLERDQAQFFRATGRRTPEGGWPAARYSATADLLRDGVSIGQIGDSLDLR
jgi:hypothetical protein